MPRPKFNSTLKALLKGCKASTGGNTIGTNLHHSEDKLFEGGDTTAQLSVSRRTKQIVHTFSEYNHGSPAYSWQLMVVRGKIFDTLKITNDMLMKHHQSSSFYNLKTYVHAGHLDLVQ
jgi:hypothetical protein